MNPRDTRILTECATLLNRITERYTTAVRRLTNEALPGFPARTPASGEPGGGRGFTAGSITERLALAYHPELADLELMLALPRFIAASACQLSDAPALPLTATSSAWLLITRLSIVAALTRDTVPSKPLATLHRHIDQLDRLTTIYGYTPTKPKPASNPHLLADDPTDTWCRSCLRIGNREPRYRGDLCQWCYRFERTEGFPVPAPIAEKRAHGTVYDRDVEPFRRAWREQQKRRKKAG